MIIQESLGELVEANYSLTVNRVIPMAIDKFKVETPGGLKCLSRIQLEPERLFFGYLVSEMVRAKGFQQITLVQLTKEGLPSFYGIGGYWVLSEWINGQAIGVETLTGVEAVTKDLAYLHTYLQGYQSSTEVKTKKEWINWPEKVVQKQQFYRGYLKQVKNTPTQTAFQELLLNRGEIVQDSLNQTVERILSPAGQELTLNEKNLRTVTLGAIRTKEMIVGLDGKTYFLNPFKMKYDVRVKDLGLWIKYLVKKHPIPSEVIPRVLTWYEEIRPLSRGEWAYLLGYLYYPEKALKVLERYVFRKKQWTEEGYVRKLRKTLEKLEREVTIYAKLESKRRGG